MSVVIDTNVTIVANGGHAEASLCCVSSCIAALGEAKEAGVLIDDEFLIIDEYKKHLSFSGQPGVGDAFFKWLWSNQENSEVCRKIHITPSDENFSSFEEFPTDARLEAFDRSDKKFVAVATASNEDPEILNAVDTDWWIFREALNHHGIRIRFLCAETMG